MNRIHFLIIENNATQVELVKETVLEIGNYNLHYAKTIKKAKIILELENINLILSDLNIDDCLGVRTLQEIRKYSNAPIIVTSWLELDQKDQNIAKELECLFVPKKGSFAENLKKMIIKQLEEV